MYAICIHLSYVLYVCMYVIITIVNRVHDFESHVVHLGRGSELGGGCQEIVLPDFELYLLTNIVFELVELFLKNLYTYIHTFIHTYLKKYLYIFLILVCIQVYKCMQTKMYACSVFTHTYVRAYVQPYDIKFVSLPCC